MNINHFAEIPEDYRKAIDAADTVGKLLDAIMPYKEVASDAVEAVKDMRPGDFKEWRTALRKERRGMFCGEKYFRKFEAILMPSVMFEISMVADQFKVPWGLAYNRLKDTDILTIKNGIAELRK